MSNYKGDKPKIYELAKEMGLSTKELLSMCKDANLPYTGISSVVDGNLEEFKKMVQDGIDAGNEADLLESRERGVNLVGMYFNPESRTYHVADIKLTREEFERLGGTLDKGHGTVYIAKPKLGAKMEHSGIFRPSKYAKEKK